MKSLDRHDTDLHRVPMSCAHIAHSDSKRRFPSTRSTTHTCDDLEALFHGAAAVVLAWAARTRRWPTLRLAAYLASYAVLRFLLEFWRQHPPVALGLSWHQWLALGLFALAGGTLWVRVVGRRPRRHQPASSNP